MIRCGEVITNSNFGVKKWKRLKTLTRKDTDNPSGPGAIVTINCILKGKKGKLFVTLIIK